MYLLGYESFDALSLFGNILYVISISFPAYIKTSDVIVVAVFEFMLVIFFSCRTRMFFV
jgi:hypothetical protein